MGGTSTIDQRRLRDGARALETSSHPAETADELRAQIESVEDGIRALQSLDDLGHEGNERAERDQAILWNRLHMLEHRLKELTCGGQS